MGPQELVLHLQLVYNLPSPFRGRYVAANSPVNSLEVSIIQLFN